LGGVATIIPLGNVSVKPTPVKATVAFGFVIVKLIVTTPMIGDTDAENDFMIVGGATTVIEAMALVPVPPLAELTLPVLLFFTPAVVPVTVTLNVQGAPNATVAPLSTIRLLPVTVSVPPH
jgi:hypothetical protein